MERIFLRLALPVFYIFTFSQISSAQDLSGIWKGYFISEGGGQYKLEFQIKTNATSGVTGVSYSWGDNISFYGKATMSGSYNRRDKQFQIQEIRTVEVKIPGGGGTCLMKYLFSYDKSGKEEFLEGTFIGKSEDRKNPKNNGDWGDCGGGKVYLRRVQTSDFYVEPFLRDKPQTRTLPSTAKTDSAVIKKNLPRTNPLKRTGPPLVKKTTSPPGRNNSQLKKKPIVINPGIKTDTARAIVQPSIKNPVQQKKIVITPEILKTRENALAQTIIVNTEEVTIKLYDNGEIDGDTISVFVDKRLLLSHKRLGSAPISLSLKFDADDSEHEVIMVAENLGRIPPNTSLMVISAGDKRYQVQITSTEQKNAMVKFKYEKSSP